MRATDPFKESFEAQTAQVVGHLGTGISRWRYLQELSDYGSERTIVDLRRNISLTRQCGQDRHDPLVTETYVFDIVKTRQLGEKGS